MAVAPKILDQVAVELVAVEQAPVHLHPVLKEPQELSIPEAEAEALVNLNKDLHPVQVVQVSSFFVIRIRILQQHQPQVHQT